MHRCSSVFVSKRLRARVGEEGRNSMGVTYVVNRPAQPYQPGEMSYYLILITLRGAKSNKELSK